MKYGQGWRGILKCISLVRRVRKETWDIGIEMRGDIRQILLLALIGPLRRVGFDFSGGGDLLTDVVFDDGSYAHLANHHQRIAEHLGIWPENTEYRPFLRLTEEEVQNVKNTQPFIGFHFGASLPLKRLPNLEAVKLLHNWQGANLPIFIFVPPDDKVNIQHMIMNLPDSLKSKITIWSGGLRDFIVTVSKAKHLFAMDSGPAHIAAALGVNVTIFYGPTVSDYVRPLGENVEIIQKEAVTCRPCDQIHCSNPKKHYCMNGLVSLAKVGDE